MNRKATIIGAAIVWASPVLAELPATWPDPRAMEQRIWQHLQKNADLKFTSIDRVECSEVTCEIGFTGPAVNDNAAVYDLLISKFVLQLRREKIPVRQVRTAKTEVSPGVPGIIVTLSSVEPTPRQTGRSKAKEKSAEANE